MAGVFWEGEGLTKDDGDVDEEEDEVQDVLLARSDWRH